jgi:hypothetical protein
MPSIRRVLSLWFGFHQPVDRLAYALTGLALMLFKYAVDASVIGWVAGVAWTPLDYLSPLLLTRKPLIEHHEMLMLALLAWTIPFVWIGASMTFRRVLDAGLKPWMGLVFFVPAVNYPWLLVLCLLPSHSATAAPELAPPAPASGALRAIRAAGPGAALGLGATIVSVLAFGTYLAGLFVATPFVVGFVAGFRAWREGIVRRVAVTGVAQLSLLLTAGTLVLFALEGVVCIAMVYPLAAALAELGAELGFRIAQIHRMPPVHAAILLLALPLLTGAEAASWPGAPLREVLTTIVVDAPPERVWPRVVGFSELPPPNQLVFALGIAYPMRARIEGEGIGAIRHCEFSTGAFVEPVTAWEPPRRLAFDVVSQPQPMHETSPYPKVYAPHLVDGLRSERGEFRLILLPDGRTRLEGRTWYRVEMAPQFYWGALSDALIHAIHQRVLAHVKSLAEADAG